MPYQNTVFLNNQASIFLRLAYRHGKKDESSMYFLHSDSQSKTCLSSSVNSYSHKFNPVAANKHEEVNKMYKEILHVDLSSYTHYLSLKKCKPDGHENIN